MPTRLYAVILTWNSEQYIDACLGSLFKEASYSSVDLSVCVVDNGSTDSTPQRLEHWQRRGIDLDVISLPTNAGTTASRNMALKRRRGQYVLICDSDVEWQQGALQELLTFAARHPKAGIMAPKVVLPDGRVQVSAKRFPSPFQKLLKASRIRGLVDLAESIESYPHHMYTQAMCPDYCISAAWLLRAEAIDSIGLFDERIFYAPEDVDYCVRCWASGWQVWYVPSAHVVHHTQRLSYSNARIALAHLQGLWYFFMKHRYIRPSILRRRLNMGAQ